MVDHWAEFEAKNSSMLQQPGLKGAAKAAFLFLVPRMLELEQRLVSADDREQAYMKSLLGLEGMDNEGETDETRATKQIKHSAIPKRRVADQNDGGKEGRKRARIAGRNRLG